MIWGLHERENIKGEYFSSGGSWPVYIQRRPSILLDPFWFCVQLKNKNMYIIYTCLLYKHALDFVGYILHFNCYTQRAIQKVIDAVGSWFSADYSGFFIIFIFHFIQRERE